MEITTTVRYDYTNTKIAIYIKKKLTISSVRETLEQWENIKWKNYDGKEIVYNHAFNLSWK